MLYTYIQIMYFFDMRKNIFGRIIRPPKKTSCLAILGINMYMCNYNEKISKSMDGLI